MNDRPTLQAELVQAVDQIQTAELRPASAVMARGTRRNRLRHASLGGAVVVVAAAVLAIWPGTRSVSVSPVGSVIETGASAKILVTPCQPGAGECDHADLANLESAINAIAGFSVATTLTAEELDEQLVAAGWRRWGVPGAVVRVSAAVDEDGWSRLFATYPEAQVSLEPGVADVGQGLRSGEQISTVSFDIDGSEGRFNLQVRVSSDGELCLVGDDQSSCRTLNFAAAAFDAGEWPIMDDSGEVVGRCLVAEAGPRTREVDITTRDGRRQRVPTVEVVSPLPIRVGGWCWTPDAYYASAVGFDRDGHETHEQRSVGNPEELGRSTSDDR